MQYIIGTCQCHDVTHLCRQSAVVASEARFCAPLSAPSAQQLLRVSTRTKLRRASAPGLPAAGPTTARPPTPPPLRPGRQPFSMGVDLAHAR